ncbi:hypothetical protein B0H34DRAFT_717545 [Crassisporium funariophilum]|nr:hypothetical protein B0H34DRAFT_717545 [Crassisporium funariophilum]
MSMLSPVSSAATVGGIANNVDDASLVYHVNLVFVAIIGLFVVVRLPRAIALFGTSSEWFNGHFLRYKAYRPRNRVVQAVHDAYPPPSASKEHSTDDSHTLYTHAPHVLRVTEKGAPVSMNYPPHIPSCIKPLRPLLTPLRSRIAPGFSVAQLLILSIYFYCLLYASFYRSNIFTDSARTGWISVAQMPLVFAFAQKNNILGSFIGFGYEKLNFLHRFAGRVVVLAANVHSLHYFYQWSLDGTFKQSMKRSNSIWGLVALICIDMIFFFSTAYWRQRAYNLFLTTHIFGFIFVLPAAYMHKPPLLPYIYACLALYLFDHLMRAIKTRITTATIRPMPELDITRVEIPGFNAGWRAGQHVRLRVLSFGMGWWGWSEVHPFTIASVSGGQDGLVLMIKKTGTWTKNLYEIAKMSGYTEGGHGREIKVMVEGPYGGPGHTVFSSFSAAVFVAGGSGISFALSAIQDLIQKDLQGESRVKVIELVWTVQDPACLVPLLPTLTSLIQQSVFTHVRISVFYTRAPTGKFPFAPTEFFQPGLTLAPGRPRISKVLDAAIARAVSLGSGSKDDEGITGMVVAVCGPVSLADDVVGAVGSVEPLRRDQVGGIEIHEEVFGW